MAGSSDATARRLRAARAAAQLLSGGSRPPTEAVAHLLAVQAQDPRSARLALRARCEGLRGGAIDASLADGSLVAGWLLRGTLHLVARADYPWLLGLTAPGRQAANRRRLDQEGVSSGAAERAVQVIERALADEGPLARGELAERLARAGVRTEGQALPHLLLLAVIRGVALLGPPRGDGQAYVLGRDWLGAAPPTRLEGEQRRSALGELARRYLQGYGPAGAADLAAWSGLPLRDARAALAAAGGGLVEWGDGLTDVPGRGRRAPAELPARLLPSFDPYLLGWKDRGFGVPAEHERRVHPGGGMLRAVATVDGVVAGTWSVRRRDRRVSVTLGPFGPLGHAATAALQAEADDVVRFLSEPAPP